MAITPAYDAHRSASMAIAPAYDVVDEEELLSLKSLVYTDGEDDESMDEIYRDMEEDLKSVLRRAADLEAAEFLSMDDLAWAHSWEAHAAETAQDMADQVEGIRRGVAVLDTRPGEEAVAAELRRQDVIAGALRDEADRVVAAARRLQERERRRWAAVAGADPAAPWFLGYVASELEAAAMEDGYVPTAEEMAAAARLDDVSARVEEKMARVAGSLRRDAAERHGEEEEAMETQAADADAVRKTVEAFRASVRRYQAAGEDVAVAALMDTD